jgi:hypothetical protein
MAAISDAGDWGSGLIKRHATAELNAMLATGVISADEFARMIAPTHYRSRNDLLAPFGVHGRFVGLAVEHLDIVQAPDPIWEAYETDNDANSFGHCRGGDHTPVLGRGEPLIIPPSTTQSARTGLFRRLAVKIRDCWEAAFSTEWSAKAKVQSRKT